MEAAPLILASGSPRRRELLGFLNVPFRVIATDAEEQDISPPPAIAALIPPARLPRTDHPTLRAWRKVQAACAEAPDGVIIGADTIVVLDGDVINKPRDAAHARALLRQLSGQTHTVYTGLIVLNAQTGNVLAELVASTVVIADLSDAQIAAYVATGEPLDKAGAYGIQGLGGRLVREVVGSYTCVVGLPLVKLHALLVAAGVTGMSDPTEAYRRWLGAHGKEPLPCPPTFP